MSEGLEILYLDRDDISRIEIEDSEIVEAVEQAFAAQGRGEYVQNPRANLRHDPTNQGFFNILAGYLAHLDLAGFKVVGDFVPNYKLGLASELGYILLMRPDSGVPVAIVDASHITDMRTGAVSATGARHLAPRAPRVLANIGARGSSYWNVRLIAALFDFEEIRIHSRRAESREALAARLAGEAAARVVVCSTWEEAIRGADVIVEATRLVRPEPLFRSEWVKPGSLVIPYGSQSALEDGFLDVCDKVVIDTWSHAHAGPYGALRHQVDSGALTQENLHAEIGQIVNGDRPGRQSDAETILFWHRGQAISDIALAAMFMAKARRDGVGRVLPY